MSGQGDEWTRRFPSAIDGLLEKRFDIREKMGNFVYRHGIEYVFWWYLKLLIFCLLGKKPCRFFMSLLSAICTCET